MKKLLLLVTVIPLITNAQDTRKDKAGKPVFVGISFSPDYANRSLINNDGSSSSDMVIDVRNENEKGKFGFTTGLNMIIKLSEKLEFQTGIHYSNKGYKTPKLETVYEVPVPNPPTHFKTRSSFNFLELPLKFNLISGKARTKFVAGTGLAVNFLLSEKETGTLYYSDGTKREFDQYSDFDYNKFNLSALLSAGIEFSLKQNIMLRAEPTFRYGLLKIIDKPVTARLWNIGLNAGVYYKLK